MKDDDYRIFFKKGYTVHKNIEKISILDKNQEKAICEICFKTYFRRKFPSRPFRKFCDRHTKTLMSG